MSTFYPSYQEVDYRMDQTMRWYGPRDRVTLADIKQSGCTGVVSALHHVSNGDVWTVEEIEERVKVVEAAGLKWEVVESVAVPECIKTQTGDFQFYIDNFKQSIRNLSKCGIKVITYNFMPVLDWVRTNLEFEMPDGSSGLKFEWAAFVAFDLFILQRKNAEKEYTQDIIDRAKKRFEAMDENEISTLKQTMCAGLPGSERHFTMDEVREALSAYEGLSREQVQQNFIYFLKEIIPVADECGMKMAVHPDDPPFSLLGLPRIVTCAADVQTLFDAVPSTNNGLCFCTGSYGVNPDNDLPGMIAQFADRIHFIHLRSTRRNDQGDFYEDNHLEGDVDMYAVIKEIVKTMNKQKQNIPMRPDHGHELLDDLSKSKSPNPGYTAIGRLRGLAELRGVELGILRSMAEYN